MMLYEFSESEYESGEDSADNILSSLVLASYVFDKRITWN